MHVTGRRGSDATPLINRDQFRITLQFFRWAGEGDASVPEDINAPGDYQDFTGCLFHDQHLDAAVEVDLLNASGSSGSKDRSKVANCGIEYGEASIEVGQLEEDSANVLLASTDMLEACFDTGDAFLAQVLDESGATGRMWDEG